MSAPDEPPVACPVLALGDRRFVRTPDLAELAMNGKPLLDDCLGPKARILAAIDNSYSMKTWWPHVSAAWNRTAVQIREQWGAAPEAVVFNRGVKQCDQSGELNESHEPGYNTDILAVVRHLRTRMEAGPAEVPVVIVFVSDGHHTAPIASGKAFQQAFEEELHEMQACRGKLGCRVNVLVVGVGPSFPTWMAMQFRTALHNGNPGLPNVFLVNDNEGVELRFAEMRDALRSCARPLAVEVPVRLNPAASPTTELFPGLWFELPEGAEQSVTVGGRRLELVESAEQQLQAMHSMFEQWVHWVDRLALAKRHEDVKAAAAQLALIMQSMLDNAHSEAKARRPANAFADRLERKAGRTSETMAQQLVRHMKEHAAGNPWQGLSDGEMAQRLSLAPDDQNRYLQQLWMRQGRPQADFPETAAAFLREVEQVRWQELEAVRHADGTLCELTQETLGESVAGPEFAAALKACPSFYTFLHCWPLAGLGVRFRYYDGVVMNPWSLEVEACCMGDKNLDTTELLGVGADAGGVEVEAGGGQRMMVNAVVPLVTPVSALPYARLVRSELFQRVVSYSVLKMPDILEPNAHPGALAGVLLHLLQLPCGDRWRDRLLDRVAATASVFAGRAALQRHIRCLQAADPRRAFCSSTAGDERPEMDGVAAQTLAKPLLLMHVMRARGQLREIRQVVPLLDAFLTEYIGRAVDCGHMQDWFELEGLRPAGEGVGLDVGAAGVALTDETYLRSFFTENDILKDVRQRMLHAQPLCSEELLAAPVRAKLAQLQGLRSHSIRTAGLRGILDHFLQPCEDRDAAAAAADELLSDAAVAARMAHAVKWHGSRDRMQHRVLPWPDARRGIQETLLHNAYVERRRKLELELQEQASAAWTAEFRRLHEQNPRPLPLPEVLRQLQARRPQAARKRAGQLDYNPQTGLLRNACMVPTCPFFLQPRTDFDAHLAHLQLLPDFVPGLHRTAALLRAQPPHSIAQAVARGECLWQEGTGVPAAPSQPPEAWVASLATEYLRLEAQGVGVGEAACQPTDVLGHAGRPHRIIPLP